jgi:hypothetical protein
MKLYHISQSQNNEYDTFSDLIVAAESEEEARGIHPEASPWKTDPWNDNYGCWCKSPDQVKVEYIGEAAKHIEKGIVCASFHAG